MSGLPLVNKSIKTTENQRVPSIAVKTEEKVAKEEKNEEKVEVLEPKEELKQ